MVGVYPIAKILTLKGTRRLVSLAQNDRISLCVFITGRRGRRPLRGSTKIYLFVKFKFV